MYLTMRDMNTRWIRTCHSPVLTVFYKTRKKLGIFGKNKRWNCIRTTYQRSNPHFCTNYKYVFKKFIVKWTKTAASEILHFVLFLYFYQGRWLDVRDRFENAREHFKTGRMLRFENVRKYEKKVEYYCFWQNLFQA